MKAQLKIHDAAPKAVKMIHMKAMFVVAVSGLIEPLPSEVSMSRNLPRKIALEILTPAAHAAATMARTRAPVCWRSVKAKTCLHVAFEV